MKNQRYVLTNGEPQPCDNLEEWAMWMNESNCRVALDRIGDVSVSTVFLGVAPGDVDGVPILFETIVLTSNLVRRHTTYQQALAGHAQTVRDLSAV
jgi:hypothetical protein